MPRWMRQTPKFISSVLARAEKPKPALRITEKQWKKLLERVTEREASVAHVKPGQATEFVMGQQPPTTRIMGRVQEPITSGGQQIGMQPRDYPYPEAAIRYLRSKREGQQMLKPGGHVPPADVLSSKGGEVAYERRIWRPIEDPVRRAELAAEEVTQEAGGIAQTPQNEEFVKQSGELKKRGEKVMQSIQKVQKAQMTPSEELIKMGILGDRLWKYIGGQRTLTGKYWNALREGSRGRKKVQDTRDYFIRSFLRWSQDSDAFAKTAPREAKSIERIWQDFRNEFREEL